MLVWKRTLASNASDDATGIAVDSNGSVYASGSTFGILGAQNFGQQDGYLARFGANGDTQWVHQYGSSGSSPFDEGTKVATDGVSGLVTVGGTLGDLAGPNAGTFDGFVGKYDFDGNLIWTRQFGSALIDSANDVTTDEAGVVYVAGQTDGSLGGDSLGGRDAFVRRYDGDGNLQWSRQVGSALFDVGLGIATDARNSVFLAGFSIEGPGSLPTGDQDVLIAKLSDTGDILWQKNFGTDARDSADGGVAVDPFGNIYVAGSTDGVLDGESGGSRDAFLAKFDTQGDLLWLRQWGGGLREGGAAVATDVLGNAYLAGSILTPSSGAVTSSDAFVLKFEPDGDLAWEWIYDDATNDSIRDITVDAAGDIFAVGRESGASNVNGNAFVLKLHQVPEPSSIWLALGAVVVSRRLRSAHRNCQGSLIA
jgi:hypothetical protein